MEAHGPAVAVRVERASEIKEKDIAHFDGILTGRRPSLTPR
jgi:hypothetical protein